MSKSQALLCTSILLSKALRNVALALLVSAMLPLAAKAQITVGHITGTITDASGAVIPSAQVTLTNDGTGVSAQTMSTSTGSYTFVQVDPGTYSVSVQAKGFTSAVAHGIVVHVQDTVTQNYKLAVGSVSTEVTVTEATPLLQAQDASVGQMVDEQLVNNLPLVNRDWTTLAHIAPGTTTTNGSAQTSEAFSSNGVNSVQNDMRLNGIDDNMEFYGSFGTFTNAGGTAIVPAPDALREFKLEEGNYSAQFGHSTGSVLDAVIKSGTNTYHGDLWEYVRNTAFNANNWFSNHNNIPRSRAAYHQNVFGGTIGGPVRLPFRDKGLKNTFWFFDAERTLATFPNTVTATVPTALMNSSNFTNLSDLIRFNSGSNTDKLGRKFPTGTVMDPATTRNLACGTVDLVTALPGPACGSGQSPGTIVTTVRDPFYTGNIVGVTDYTAVPVASLDQIPVGRIDPNAVKLLNLYPLPTVANSYSGNWVSPRTYNLTINQYDLRIDSNLNQSNSIWGVWDVDDVFEVQPGTLPGLAEGANYGAGTDWSPHWAAAGGYTHVFSPTMTNAFRFGYQNADDFNVPPYGNQTGIPAQFGINGVAGGPGLGGLPNIGISKLTSLGVSGYNPVSHTSPNWEIDEVLTKVHGNHTFNVGYQLTNIVAHLRQPTNGTGGLSYNGGFSDITTNTTGYTAVADLLLDPAKSHSSSLGYYEGGPSSEVLSTAAFIDSERWYNAAFFQDDWKIRPNLTLNLGLRWDKYGPTIELHDRQANLVGSGAGNGPGGILYVPKSTCGSLPANFTAELAKDSISVQCTNNRGVMQMQNLNFAPRVGFAYQITPTFVVRGGYGITYGSLGNIGAAPYVLGNNYPFVFSVQATSGSSTVPITYADNGLPSLENAFQELNISSPANATIKGLQVAGMGINDKYQTPYIESFNLTVQKQLGRHDAVQAAYVGDVGRHLDSRGNYNQPSIFIPVGANQNNYIPFPDLGRGGAWLVTTGSSSYNSMQLVYNHQVGGGLEVTANYTYSHCLTDQSDISEGVPYRAQFLAGFGIAGDYTNCPDDAKHVSHISGAYALPFGTGKQLFSSVGRGVNEVIGGWTVNYIYSYQSGQPFTVSSAISTSGAFSAVAQIVGDQYAGAKTVNHWLNASAFANPPVYDGSANYDQGFAPLGPKELQSRGPSFYNVDSSVSKNFGIKGESTYLQFRAEAFNLLNNPQFGRPGNLNYTSPNNFASITSTRNANRILQLALKLYY